MERSECGNCEHCEGATVLQFLVIDKFTHEVLTIEEEPRYQCELFGLIKEADECFNFKPIKEVTNYLQEVEH